MLNSLKKTPRACRVLELGAGNGITGAELRKLGFESIVGLDILNEARTAALRDRPEVYDSYFVLDLSTALLPNLRTLAAQRYNVLLVVAAVGMGHLDSKALKMGFQLLEDGGLVVFNIYRKLIDQNPPTEFDDMLAKFRYSADELFKQDYVHRMSVSGSEVYYSLFIFRKNRALVIE